MAVNNNPVAGTIPTLYYDQVSDTVARKCFQNLNEYFSSQNQLYGFNFFELVFTGAVTNQKNKHGLSYIPQDVSVVRVTGPGSVTFNFGLFDTTYYNVSASGACRVRFFIGTYWNQQTATQSATGDVQSYLSLPVNTTSTKQYMTMVSGVIALYTPQAPQVTFITAIGSGTYIVPTGTLYLRVRMVGPGGGGGGSAAATPTNGGTSTATTFGASFLSAGAGGAFGLFPGAAVGGTSTNAFPLLAKGIVAPGQPGGKSDQAPAGISYVGATGGSSLFGEGGVGGTFVSNTGRSALGYGSGGGGAWSPAAGVNGAGGGGGGFIDVIIAAPLAINYPYVVTAGGAAGLAGTSGSAGGVGAQGCIEVTAYFQ